MSQNVVVRARVNESVKTRAAAVLATMGLTVSDLMRMTLTRVANDKALPFDLTPNAETIAAMEELDAGRGKQHESAQALFRELGI